MRTRKRLSLFHRSRSTVYKFNVKFVIMSERFRVTKSEKSVLFRNYGATEEPDSEVLTKPDGSQIVIGNNRLPVNKEEDERDTGRKT